MFLFIYFLAAFLRTKRIPENRSTPFGSNSFIHFRGVKFHAPVHKSVRNIKDFYGGDAARLHFRNMCGLLLWKSITNRMLCFTSNYCLIKQKTKTGNFMLLLMFS